MLSLQNRIALILVLSMMAVLLAGMGVSFFVVTHTDPDVLITPAADFMAGLENIDTLPTESPRGLLLPGPTAMLKAELAKRGAEGEARIIEEATTKLRVAAYHLPNGRWATMEVPELPPPPRGAWVVLATWLSLTVVGVGTIALITARRVTEPFAIIERAVSSVGPSGELPHFTIVGSAEARRMKMALNSLSNRLTSAMQARMRLVAAAGHDLRTPMTRMRLRAELLPEDDQNDWLNDLDELDQIAKSAIELVREEGDPRDTTNIELGALVRETVDDLIASNLPVRIGTIERATVRGGPLSLRRALRNLITNAATYGEGATVSMALLGATVLVKIEDDGPGIPEHMLAQVFEPFFRADPSRGNSKGAGLGLTIANEIIERLGGSLTIENRQAGGLLQVVALPVI